MLQLSKSERPRRCPVQKNFFALPRTGTSSLATVLKQVAAPSNFWLLADPALTQSTEAAFFAGDDVALCRAALEAHRSGEELDLALAAITHRPIAIEYAEPLEEGDPLCDDRRRFRLPGAASALVRTLPFEAGGFGGSVWDAGIALAVWLSLGSPDGGRAAVANKRVLELGSGAGLGGIAAALVGAASVVLSDYGEAAGEEEGARPAAGTRPAAVGARPAAAGAGKSRRLQATLGAAAGARDTSGRVPDMTPAGEPARQRGRVLPAGSG